MYFTMNIVFTNFIDQFNLMEELEAPILTNKTTLEYTLPTFLNKSMFGDTLLSAPLSSEDWDEEKAKAREQKSLIDFMPPDHI